MAPESIPKPTGADEVRAAVIEVAGRHFAKVGTRASLRDIAAEARVNLGLIHRHIGNKDDLLRAVLESRSQSGLQIVESTADPSDAMSEIFRATIANGLSVRTLAWLLLSDEDRDKFPVQFPVIEELARRLGAGSHIDLIGAFALTYGWTVFGEQLVDAFGNNLDDKSDIDEQLALLVGRLVSQPIAQESPLPARGRH